MENKVEGRTYTSNLTKLLKHLDKIKDFQDNKPISPVMIHLALTNRCNLNCSYCCYGNRDKANELTEEQAISVIDQFSSIGTKGIEITGGGEPTLHPSINKIINYAKTKGSVGLITNAVNPYNVTEWDKLSWLRVSFHIYNQGGTLDKQIQFLKTKIVGDIGGVYIWSDGSEKVLPKVLETIEKYKMPTRITPDLTKSVKWIQENMPIVSELVKDSKYAFVSDFNIKYTREHNYCYMHLIKPYIHPDGYVYVCPGASFSPENFCNVSNEYKLCSIEDITKTYTSIDNLKDKHFNCKFCKYQHQNDFMKEIKTEVNHIDFA